MGIRDYLVGFLLSPLVMQIAVRSVQVCLSLTDIDCFMELNCPSVTFIALEEHRNYFYCIKLNFHPYFEFEVFLVFQIPGTKYAVYIENELPVFVMSFSGRIDKPTGFNSKLCVQDGLVWDVPERGTVLSDGKMGLD